MRIRQELLLGVGGVRALAAMGIAPGVLHLNEGHSAFAALELVRQRMAREGIDAWRGRCAALRPQVVFTTHTPVPAGHDRFSRELDRRASRAAARSAGARPTISSWRSGASNRSNPNEDFCMTVLALKLSRRANAVSSLHGQVSRAMWTPLFPSTQRGRVPIGHITNGVHVPTGWRRRCARSTTGIWARTGHSSRRAGLLGARSTAIDDGELWETHQTLKTQLIDFVAAAAAQQAERRGEPPERRRAGCAAR